MLFPRCGGCQASARCWASHYVFNLRDLSKRKSSVISEEYLQGRTPIRALSAINDQVWCPPERSIALGAQKRRRGITCLGAVNGRHVLMKGKTRSRISPTSSPTDPAAAGPLVFPLGELTKTIPGKRRRPWLADGWETREPRHLGFIPDNIIERS